jgi:hypothetical protein
MVAHICNAAKEEAKIEGTQSQASPKQKYQTLSKTKLMPKEWVHGSSGKA